MLDIDSYNSREVQLKKKQDELKQLKDAIYDKVMKKKEDLERVTAELAEKENALKEQEAQLENQSKELQEVKA